MTKTLAILSDSIGVGQGVSPHKSWVHLLSEYLGDDWYVINASRNGDTTRLALERLHYDVLGHNPDVVYIQLGNNDANVWKETLPYNRVMGPEYKANMASLIARCRAGNVECNVRILLGNNHAASYNHYLDDLSKIADGFIDHTKYKGDYMLDHIHLNELGHRLYFENIRQFIK